MPASIGPDFSAPPNRDHLGCTLPAMSSSFRTWCSETEASTGPGRTSACACQPEPRRGGLHALRLVRSAAGPDGSLERVSHQPFGRLGLTHHRLEGSVESLNNPTETQCNDSDKLHGDDRIEPHSPVLTVGTETSCPTCARHSIELSRIQTETAWDGALDAGVQTMTPGCGRTSVPSADYHTTTKWKRSAKNL